MFNRLLAEIILVKAHASRGQRSPPIMLNDMVTMIHSGNHGGQHVYEPINNWVKSPEDGLRYHRSMDVDDVYEGCLDMATFGRPVVGPVSDDNQWLINPLKYDPTRPHALSDQSGEIPEQLQHSMATPITDPVTLGEHTKVTIASDVDLGLMTELGAAIIRGAAETRA